MPLHRYKIQTSEIAKTFPLAGHSEFVFINILGQLPRIKTGNKFKVAITDKYSKLTRAIPTLKIISAQVGHVVSHDWVIPYSIPDLMLSDDGH